MRYILTILFALCMQSVYAQGRKTTEKQPYAYVQQMPEAPYDVYQYIKKNFKYPAEAVKDNVSGDVIARFVVTESGTITEATITKKLHPAIDKEMLRVIRSFPKWKPGMQDGKAVKVYYTLPMNMQKPNIKK